MFDPQQLDETIYLSGVMMETNSDTLFEDLKTISKKYAKIKPQIKHLKKPVYTVVATSSKKLFMGDMTEKANKQMASLKIEKGQWIVKVPVKYHTQALLPAKVAEFRKKFYQGWLPYQDFDQDDAWQDLEVYHYRKRRFRKATKMVMELWFCIKPIQKDKV